MKSQLKTPKQVKVTAVVTMLKVFGDKINNSRNANPKKLLNKPNKWLNSKKKALNRPKKHLKRLRRSIDDASKGLRVLLDKASSSDLLFIKKKDPKSQKYIPNMKRATHGRVLLRRHLSNKKVGVIDYSASKSVKLTPDMWSTK
jgi:hypothetical protein